MQKKSSYILAIIGICILLVGVYTILLHDTSSPEADITNQSIPQATSLDPATLEMQEETYVQAVSVLVAASSTITAAEVESFLFGARVPYTFQSVHLGFAQSWATQSEMLDEVGLAKQVAEYYQSIIAL